MDEVCGKAIHQIRVARKYAVAIKGGETLERGGGRGGMQPPNKRRKEGNIQERKGAKKNLEESSA